MVLASTVVPPTAEQKMSSRPPKHALPLRPNARTGERFPEELVGVAGRMAGRGSAEGTGIDGRRRVSLADSGKTSS